MKDQERSGIELKLNLNSDKPVEMFSVDEEGIRVLKKLSNS